MNALETAHNKKRETLLCCLERSAFATATAEITENNEITYDELKDALKTRYSGDDYKRLRNLKFKPGMKITDVRQPWTNLQDCYFEYLIIRFHYLIIHFDYLIIG